ncbi:unnamed protein product [Schistocephalus solidus]|uniref:Uncharacterized protein n=1 Tax=Schistocephalus solidus TaxID=70667 RepID=A0A183SI56_SCHSO|nr:unnamed protein product [Schistocephalus solidus]
MTDFKSPPPTPPPAHRIWDDNAPKTSGTSVFETDEVSGVRRGHRKLRDRRSVWHVGTVARSGVCVRSDLSSCDVWLIEAVKLGGKVNVCRTHTALDAAVKHVKSACCVCRPNIYVCATAA